MSGLAVEFINTLRWPRRYNYWAGVGWLTGWVIDREDAVRLVRRGEVIGVWQCFGSLDEPCGLRDILVFEVDANECLGRESLDCVLRHVRGLGGIIEPILEYEPVIYWNGGKSLYIIIYLDPPAPANYVLRREWVEFAREVGFDLQESHARHAVRVLGTPHQRTGERGVLLDAGFNIINELVVHGVNPYYFLEPPGQLVNEDVRGVNRDLGRPRRLPTWVRRLIEYLRETGELCHFGRLAIATWLLYLGHGEEEVVDVFRHARNFDERRTRYEVRYVYEKWVKLGRPPISCRTVMEKCGGNKVPNPLCEWGGGS